jgi:hypothetical protein
MQSSKTNEPTVMLFMVANFAIEGDGFLTYLSTHSHQFHFWYLAMALPANAAVVVAALFFCCTWRLKTSDTHAAKT